MVNLKYSYDMLGDCILPNTIPLGLPYMGSKRKIAPQLLKKLNNTNVLKRKYVSENLYYNNK